MKVRMPRGHNQGAFVVSFYFENDEVASDVGLDEDLVDAMTHS